MVPVTSSLLALAAALGCVRVTFPGQTTTCVAAGAAYVVRWAEAAAEGGDHRLLLRRAGTRHETVLLAFPRQVELLWSPSGRQLALTNRRTSDESTVLLWTDLAKRPRDLLHDLAAHEGQQTARWNTHHLYLEAQDWVADDRLSVRLWGYGDPSHKLDRRYVYTVGQGFSSE